MNETSVNPLTAQADAAQERLRARMRWRQADTKTRLEIWAADGIPAVLMDGDIPRQFLQTPKALLSECGSLMAVVSGLDHQGVEYLATLLSGSEPPEVRVVLLVHATCPTKEKDLFDVLALLNTKRLQVWVLPVSSWGQRCLWVLAARKDSPSHILWAASSGNFGLADPEIDDTHLVTDADPLVADQFVYWFVTDHLKT
jgi:hypothetical protein